MEKEFIELKNKTFYEWFKQYDSDSYSKENCSLEAFEQGKDFALKYFDNIFREALDSLNNSMNKTSIFSPINKSRLVGAIVVTQILKDTNAKISTI